MVAVFLEKFKRSKPQKDSYALSDKLWAELERS